jgi:hypothetical protein
MGWLKASHNKARLKKGEGSLPLPINNCSGFFSVQRIAEGPQGPLISGNPEISKTLYDSI